MEGTLSQGTKGEDGYVPQNVTVDTAAESFVRDGLSKVMKITNICDSEHLSDCGLPDKIITINGGSTINLSSISTLGSFNSIMKRVVAEDFRDYEHLDTKAAAFETVNGESVLVYYNPDCEANSKLSYVYHIQTQLCANFVYDLNGKKGPNTVGKDIGVITAIYSIDPVVVAPNPFSGDYSEYLAYDDANSECKKLSIDARLPNIEELKSMIYNKTLFVMNNGGYCSNTKYSGNMIWCVSRAHGNAYLKDISYEYPYRCVKK